MIEGTLPFEQQYRVRAFTVPRLCCRVNGPDSGDNRRVYASVPEVSFSKLGTMAMCGFSSIDASFYCNQICILHLENQLSIHCMNTTLSFEFMFTIFMLI